MIFQVTEPGTSGTQRSSDGYDRRLYQQSIADQQNRARGIAEQMIINAEKQKGSYYGTDR